MAKFCVHERHGGICEKTGTYCNLGACPYEDLKEFVPLVHGLWKHDHYRSKLSRQQLKTLRGQILSGNIDGAMRGLDKILKQKKEVHHGIQDKNRLV